MSGHSDTHSEADRNTATACEFEYVWHPCRYTRYGQTYAGTGETDTNAWHYACVEQTGGGVRR